jgi:hypothetical protein
MSSAEERRSRGTVEPMPEATPATGSTSWTDADQNEGTMATARARGSEVAETTADEAKHVGGTAVDEGRQLADEAKAEIRHVAADARAQLREQASAQADKAAHSLRRFGDQASALAEGRPGEAGPLANYVEAAAEEIRRTAARMRDGGFEGVLDDTRRFARERPGLFLSAAAIGGFAAGRLLRGGKEMRKQEEEQESGDTSWQ